MDRVYQSIAEPRREEMIFLGYSLVIIFLPFFYPSGGLFVMTLCYLVLISLWDLCFARIPNRVTYPTMAVGIFYHTLGGGWTGGGISFLGSLLGGCLLLPGYLFGKMGAGDVKAMATLGAIWGPGASLHIFLWTALAGGIAALFVLLIRRKAGQALMRYWRMARLYFYSGQLLYLGPSPAEGDPRFPYGAVITCGFLLWDRMGGLL